jgi:branched-chain amino acid transport system ATP-binding protein
MILEVSNIYTAYGLSQILFGVSLKVQEGEVISLLGRNGVGKTTTLRSIMGLTPPKSGSIKWRGEEIVGKPTYEISRLGIGFVPEDRRIFSDLTVWENLDVGIQPGRKRENVWTLERVFDLFPALKPIQSRKGGYLSGGEQQMLTIARTLMSNPDLLLLDEPSEGLAPIVVQQLGEQIAKLRREGMTILLCEQNQRFSLDLSDRIYILEKGTIKFEGTVQDFLKDEKIGRTYLAV